MIPENYLDNEEVITKIKSLNNANGNEIIYSAPVHS